MDYNQKIAQQLKIRPNQVTATISLLDEANTIPFIARYRKEATDNLDEEQLRQVESLLNQMRRLDERRATVLASIEEQGKLTPELRGKINAVDTMVELEDLYLPFRPKRRTRASIARELGLAGVAELILKQPITTRKIDELIQPFLNEQVTSAADALAGGRDIVAELISDHADIHRMVRERAISWGTLTAHKITEADDARQVYLSYYDFNCRVNYLRPHQVLAVNRGEKEKILAVKLEIQEKDWAVPVTTYFRPDHRSVFFEQLNLAITDSAQRLLLPAIERDVRRTLSEQAERHAIQVFAVNLRGLLSQPPLAGQVVLGLDPGFRTGCKAAVVDQTGKLLATETIYPHEPKNRSQEAQQTLTQLIDRHHVTLISIGNGTASRETEQLAAQLIREKPGVKYLIASEAGASVYSASPLARAEFPQLDVSLRGAVSIARRVQDPLAELVKIDPKSIGVGLYQHDVDQGQLEGALKGVVESVVNQVGVDVNTASPALLTYVAGIGPKLAERIVAYRDENGAFNNRMELRKVTGLGPKAFEQSAGFVRIQGGDQPLDASAIHPESYAVVGRLFKLAGLPPGATTQERQQKLERLAKTMPRADQAAKLEVGELTLADIIEQLLRPGRDPRYDSPAPILRSDILKMEDLSPGMTLQGTVRNIVDFGAFVDIGVKQDGLLHRTQIPPDASLSVGSIISVEILKIEAERERIALRWAANRL